jgi:hypothetical protein
MSFKLSTHLKIHGPRPEFFSQVNMAKYPNNNMDFMIWKEDLRNKTSELGKIVQQTIFHIVDM